MKIPEQSYTPLIFNLPSFKWRSPSLFGGLIMLWIALFLLSLSLGSANIPVDQLLAIVLGQDIQNETWTQIIWQLRLPRAIAATFAGAALGVSGLQMQTLFNNPLAGPFVLGINSGASLGVALVILGTGFMGGILGDISIVMAANIGAIAVLMLVLAISRRVPHNATLLILGLMIGYVTNALVTLLLHFSQTEAMRIYLSWTFGSFAEIQRGQLPIFMTLIAVGTVIAFLCAKPLNALLLGKQYAQSIGLDLPKIRHLIIISTAILSGTVTAFCGPISFIGIAVPHLCRGLLKTVDHRLLVPAVTLLGASLALLADTIAQLPGSELSIPLNTVTALFGAPIIVFLIMRRYR